ncbi:MAG TPA: hypothetical protein VFO19_07825 [Vicinamibacterales bacterium]|nr:hypothetical protein [Vicinamibacterales bacterium]
MRVLAVAVFASAIFLASTAGPTMAQAGGAAQTVDRTIALTVLDRDGAPVRDLETEDFALTEGGEPRTIVNAALSTDPLEVVVVVNTAQPQGQIRQILDERDALKAFVTTLRAAEPQSRIALIVCSGSALSTTAFDASPAELDRRIEQLAPTYQLESSVIEAIVAAARLVGETPSPRRAIVVIDLDSTDPFNVPIEAVAAQVEKSMAAFWPISVHTSGASTAPREALFTNLPPRTGALRQTTIISRPLPEMMRQMARVLASQYLVTYRRPANSPITAIVPSVRRGARIIMSPWIR